ncbi:MAG: DEAD/DEAH box helicase [Micavibrio sp.]
MSVQFSSFGLPEQINAALIRMNYTEATPIQAQAIPLALAGRDVLGSAQTGTGKTAAFTIPMIVKLMTDPKAMALVLAPTREPAAQTLDVVHKLTSNNRAIRTALLIGGEPMGKQFAQLRENPRLIVGTPGRINDHLRRNPKMLRDVVFVAVDEADRMLDMGFSEQIDEILATLPKDRQTLMFSATFPDSIIKFSRSYLNNPERVSVNPESVSVPKIKHEVKRTTDGNKYTDLLGELEARDGSVIIFVKTQHGTDRLAKRLEHDGHESVAIHGGLRQNQRDRAVQSFRSKRFRILVATDVASRGLDIPHIEHVINYDLPQVAEDYIHRIGRTARAGAEGNAMCFVLPSDGGKWNAINRILNPGEAPIRAERGAGDRPNRGGFKSGGFKSGGYKGRDDRSGSSFGGGRDRPNGRANGQGGDFRRDRDARPAAADRFSQDRPRSDRPQSAERSFAGDRPRNDRPQNDRPYNNDRPRNDRPQGGERTYNNARPNDRPTNRTDSGKPFVKYYVKDGARNDAGRDGNRKPTDRTWNSKEGRAPYKKDDRAVGTADRGNFRREEPKRDSGNRYDRPKGDRPTGDRNFAKPAFKKDDRAGGFKATQTEGRETLRVKKPKPDAVKKPFKFKEHSRKPDEKRRAAF